MEEGEQVPPAALGDVFLWMDSEEPTLLRELLRLRNTARFWERMADRSSLYSSEGSQTALVIAKRACDLSLIPLLEASALASPGWPCGKRPCRILLHPLLAAVLIPFHGGKTVLIIHPLKGRQRFLVVAEGFEGPFGIQVPVAHSIEAVGKGEWIAHGPR